MPPRAPLIPSADSENRMVRWSIVVTARNEAVRLGGCLESVESEVRGQAASLTVLLNGSTDRSAEIVQHFMLRSAVLTRAVAISLADKSNAWNQYVYGLAPAADVHIFVDGYLHVAAGSFSALAAALNKNSYAHAASGLPSGSRSAALQREQTLRQGGLWGGLHALRNQFLERVRGEGLQLPVGLYRGDGLVGSFAMHNFDAARSPWDPARVALVAEATWDAPGFSLLELPRHLRRRINQARGCLEDEAIKSIIYPNGYAALPRFADVMLKNYVAIHPEARPGWTDVAGRLALLRLARWCAPTDEDLAPHPLISVRAGRT